MESVPQEVMKIADAKPGEVIEVYTLGPSVGTVKTYPSGERMYIDLLDKEVIPLNAKIHRARVADIECRTVTMPTTPLELIEFIHKYQRGNE